MGVLRSSVLSGGLLLVLCGTAAADSDWQTVSLDNDPSFMIDVPSAAGGNYLPSKDDKDGLMSFEVASGNAPPLDCYLGRSGYDGGSSFETLLANIAASAGKVMCSTRDDATNITVIDYNAQTLNGRPAASCVLSYTDPAEKQQGAVEAIMVVATRKNIYSLACGIYAETQDQAEKGWHADWAGTVEHIQQSLQLPKSEN
ncbi:MAG: hypothetical protein KGL56_01030 [Alphaproteobacteria bacterium]|nr:hypothetical protein [Alphaproteobacteria bacterium]MDE2162402.1 hypothetical protein [Alphaproteobacteria bacterium]MDE2498746.1 hypothetical protein [Alphaproteobacteria bacterium]